MISAIVWFGIGAICGAIILVSFSAITYDERKRKTMREGYKPNEIRPNSNNGYIRSNGNIAQQEKEDGKGKKHSDDNGLSHSEGKADEG